MANNKNNQCDDLETSDSISAANLRSVLDKQPLKTHKTDHGYRCASRQTASTARVGTAIRVQWIEFDVSTLFLSTENCGFKLKMHIC